jgi:hypothetical protein
MNKLQQAIYWPSKMLEADIHIIAKKYGVCGADIAPGLARDIFQTLWLALQREPGKNSFSS